jgi:hypothetical protein
MLILIDIGGVWAALPVALGFLIGFLGGDRRLHALMRILGHLC